jgi:hypothetical protein
VTAISAIFDAVSPMLDEGSLKYALTVGGAAVVGGLLGPVGVICGGGAASLGCLAHYTLGEAPGSTQGQIAPPQS